MEERRSQLRYRAPVLHAELLADGGSAEVKVRDVGKGGICFSQGTHLAVGQHCRIKLTLEVASGRTSAPVELAIRVVWSTADAGRVQIGAAFLALSPQQKQALEGVIYLLSRDVAEDEEGRLSFRTGLEPAVDGDEER